MVMTDIEEFYQAAKPLMEYLKNNHHPHHQAIVTCTDAELVEGKIAVSEDFHGRF